MSNPEPAIQSQPPAEPDHNVDQQSSNLDYLGNHNMEEGSREEGNESKKKGKQMEKESQIRKILINNRMKDKKIEADSAYDGIYLYKPGVELPSLYQFCNQSIKIIIASQYIKRHNPELLKRNIYGNDAYTCNSDAVCMLVHSGSININTFPNKRFEGVELTCKVIKPKKNYTGVFKNGLMSRNLKGFTGNGLKPDMVKHLASLGPMELLERYAANMVIPIGKNRTKAKPKNISNMVPIPETHIVFNMNNEPAYKYSIFNIADKGFEKGEFMIKKLDHYVLYFETDQNMKYELVKKIEMDVFDVFKVSKVKNPELTDNEYFNTNRCPLQDQEVEVIFPSLEWEEILWGNSSVLLKNQYRINGITSFKYHKKQKEAK